MKILVAIPDGYIRDSFIPYDVEKKLKEIGDVEWNENNRQFTSDELKVKIKRTDVCITGWGCPTLDKYILNEAKNLKLIAHAGGSVASITCEELYDNGIKVISGNKLFAESVAEGVIAYILAALRDIPYHVDVMHNGGWRTEDFYNEGLIGQNIGLVGFGMVVKCLIQMLRPFRVRVKVNSSYPDDKTLQEYGVERASIEEIFTTCKIISIHESLRPDTYHMINKRLLEMIPCNALLINTSRGSIIDEEILIHEINKKRFKVVLDVFETEPLHTESSLRGMDNVLLMPHMAGPTIDRRKYVTLALIQDIERYFKGESLQNEIPREYAAFMTNNSR